jgi:hypothetical protein
VLRRDSEEVIARWLVIARHGRILTVAAAVFEACPDGAFDCAPASYPG